MEKLMYLLGFILAVCGILLTIVSIFICIRNERVGKLRRHILELSSRFECREIRKGNDFIAHRHYDKLPSYEKMVYSLKPLKMEFWLSEEDVRELKEVSYLSEL